MPEKITITEKSAKYHEELSRICTNLSQLLLSIIEKKQCLSQKASTNKRQMDANYKKASTDFYDCYRLANKNFPDAFDDSSHDSIRVPSSLTEMSQESIETLSKAFKDLSNTNQRLMKARKAVEELSKGAQELPSSEAPHGSTNNTPHKISKKNPNDAYPQKPQTSLKKSHQKPSYKCYATITFVGFCILAIVLMAIDMLYPKKSFKWVSYEGSFRPMIGSCKNVSEVFTITPIYDDIDGSGDVAFFPELLRFLLQNVPRKVFQNEDFWVCKSEMSFFGNPDYLTCGDLPVSAQIYCSDVRAGCEDTNPNSREPKLLKCLLRGVNMLTEEEMAWASLGIKSFAWLDKNCVLQEGPTRTRLHPPPNKTGLARVKSRITHRTLDPRQNEMVINLELK